MHLVECKVPDVGHYPLEVIHVLRKRYLLLVRLHVMRGRFLEGDLAAYPEQLCLPGLFERRDQPALRFRLTLETVESKTLAFPDFVDAPGTVVSGVDPPQCGSAHTVLSPFGWEGRPFRSLYSSNTLSRSNRSKITLVPSLTPVRCGRMCRSNARRLMPR